MLSYCVSLVSDSLYAVAEFIRNSSQAGVLVTLGSLLFIVGTALRRHLPIPDEGSNTHTAMIWERSMPLSKYMTKADAAANAFPLSDTTLTPHTPIWDSPMPLNTFLGTVDRMENTTAAQRHINTV